MGKISADVEEDVECEIIEREKAIEATSSKQEKKRTRFQSSKSKKEPPAKVNDEKYSSKKEKTVTTAIDAETEEASGTEEVVEEIVNEEEDEEEEEETMVMTFDIVPIRNLKKNLKRSSASRRLQMNIASKLQKFIHLTNSCEDEEILLEMEKEAENMLKNIEQRSNKSTTPSHVNLEKEEEGEEEDEENAECSRPSTRVSSRASTSCSTYESSAPLSPLSHSERADLVRAQPTRQCPKAFSPSTFPSHSKRVHCDLMTQWFRAKTNIGRLIDDNRQQVACAPFIVDVECSNDGPISHRNSSTSGAQKNTDEVEILCVRTRQRGRSKQRTSATFNGAIDEQLTTKCRLTDETINLAQKILFEQFPKFVGFEDTNLGVTNGFSKHSNDPFVQILYADAHWITTSASNNSRINVFDSNSSGTLGRSFEKQICQLMRCPYNSIEIMLNSVQKQTNDIDCGLFAIAFAVDICFGTSPINRPYDVQSMRDHLRSCLIAGKFTIFPTFSGRRVSFSKSRLLVRNVFCICRQSFYSGECEGDSNLFMAKCSSCLEWYHRGCVNIPIKVFKEDKEHDRWTCPG